MTGLSCCKKANETVDTCHDGVRNQIEEGIDCGGPCVPCPSCTNGIKDQNETGIDCGGTHCAPCASCTNGIKDNDETGIDCGGTICNPCASCSDGVANQGETGIDCGGPCAPCPTTSDLVVGNYMVSGEYSHWEDHYSSSTETLTNSIISISRYDSVTIVFAGALFVANSVSSYHFVLGYGGGTSVIDFSNPYMDAISIYATIGSLNAGKHYDLTGTKIH